MLLDQRFKTMYDLLRLAPKLPPPTPELSDISGGTRRPAEGRLVPQHVPFATRWGRQGAVKMATLDDNSSAALLIPSLPQR